MHPNERLVRDFYDARAAGDLVRVRAFLADDVAWHDPYPSPHGGDLRGAETVIGQVIVEAGKLTGGSSRLIVHDVLANDRHAVALVDWESTLDGRHMAGREVAVFHVASGQITEAWFYPDEPQRAWDFFSPGKAGAL